jgi:hypothetical protein
MKTYGNLCAHDQRKMLNMTNIFRKRCREEQNSCDFFVLLLLMSRKCILPTFAKFEAEQLNKIPNTYLPIVPK